MNINLLHPTKTAAFASGLCVLFLIFSLSLGQTPLHLSIDPSTAFFAGASYSHTIRDGVYEFSDAQQSQSDSRPAVGMFGLQAGKRLRINKNLRLQIGGQFEKGTVADGTLDASENTTIKYSFTHLGIEPQLQYTFPRQDNIFPYICAGTGLNYVATREHTYLNNSSTEIQWEDIPYVSSDNISISVAGGAGFDISLSPTLLLNVSYLFRYWHPVSYEDKLDFPLSTVDYHEVFYSNVFQVNLVFALK